MKSEMSEPHLGIFSPFSQKKKKKKEEEKLNCSNALIDSHESAPHKASLCLVSISFSRSAQKINVKMMKFRNAFIATVPNPFVLGF